MTDPNADTKLDPSHNPAVWFSAALLLFPLLLCIDLFYVHPASYDGNLRTQIVTGILAVIMLVGAYWLGTVANGSQKKPADPPPAVAPVPPAQLGVAFPALLIAIALGALMLAGCASLTDAGHVAYTLEPVAGGYKFTAADGKEFASRTITVDKDGALTITEGASSAFQGQVTAGKALSILPSFAPILLPPGPAVVVPQLLAPAVKP